MDPTKNQARKESIISRRPYKHINNFIRVHINFRDGSQFPLTLDVNQTLEYVARQIEAEVTLRNLDYAEDGVPSEDISCAIEIYQLYDAANLAIPFSAKVIEVLTFEDEIFPITSVDEVDDSTEETQQRESSFLKINGSSFMLSLSPNSPEFSGGIKAKELEVSSPVNEDHKASEAAQVALISTLEDRLESVLRNTTALQFFNEFCLQEYTIENVLFWIDAEVFHSITDENCRKEFSKYIFNTYVKEGSPLALNVDGDIRKTVEEKYFANPQSDIFSDLQSFIYILIKQAAYVRFEGSHYFQSFLKFKQEDRYAYVQGKTDWNFDMLNKDHLLESPLPSRKDGENEVLYRQRILLDVLGRYSPKLKLTKSYFDFGDRKELRAKVKTIRKQKKLSKFFGGQLGEDALKHQQIETDSMSILSSNNSGRASERSTYSGAELAEGELKRKKAEKLTGFFGNQIPDRQMKRQGLQDEPAGENGEVIAEEEREIVNRLTTEEKMALQKKAKKLLGLLGTSVDGKLLTPLINKPASHPATPGSSKSPANGDFSLHERRLTSGSESSGQSEAIDKASQNADTSESDSNLSLPTSSSSSLSAIHTPQNFRIVQKSRLDKLSHVMGERISENQLKEYLDDSSAQPRPLTASEKKIFLRKNNKLERVFGGTVPAMDVINYESLSNSSRADAVATVEGRHLDSPSSLLSDKQPEISVSAIEDGKSGRLGELETVRLSSSLTSLSTISESKKAEEDRKARLMRLRKIKKMLGLNEGSSITIDALQQIQEAINNIIDDDRDKKSLLEELQVEWRNSVAAAASEKEALMSQNALSPSLQIQTANTHSHQHPISPSSPKSPKQAFTSLFSTSNPKNSPRLGKRQSKTDRFESTDPTGPALSSPKLEKKKSVK